MSRPGPPVSTSGQRCLQRLGGPAGEISDHGAEQPDLTCALGTLTDEEKEEFGRAHFALTDALLDSGHLVTSAGLTPVETAKQVTVRDGVTVATDGPFAEVKEHLAGFYLVECADMDEAVGIAARVPDAEFTYVQVRPVYDRSLLDG